MAKPILGILLGDPAGVGPEIVAKLAVSDFYTAYCRPVFIGDKRILDRAFAVVGKSVPLHVISSPKEAVFQENQLDLIDLGDANPSDCPSGKVSIEGGKACLDELTIASDLCKKGLLQGFCFVPLNKAGMKEAGLQFESEHHYLANVFGVTGPFGEINVLGNLWTTRTTSHIPLKDVSANLSVDTILRAITLCNNTLKNSGIVKPRIAVAALNPHCGENGLCGTEEIDIIKPAIEKAKAEGMDVSGPFPSDILFIKAFKGDYDGVVTMYHDQGQIALKLKGFDQGITIAGGQPYPIVTCAHGTAYDIAGKNIVSTSSFENAVKMASKMAVHMEGRK
jgi:4-hydroxythreonine-4-phosphate dehydrogenase